MPLARSHVIVICTVSPFVVGLAAYYLYRKSRQKKQAEEPYVTCPVAQEPSEICLEPIIPKTVVTCLEGALDNTESSVVSTKGVTSSEEVPENTESPINFKKETICSEEVPANTQASVISKEVTFSEEVPDNIKSPIISKKEAACSEEVPANTQAQVISKKEVTFSEEVPDNTQSPIISKKEATGSEEVPDNSQLPISSQTEATCSEGLPDCTESPVISKNDVTCSVEVAETTQSVKESKESDKMTRQKHDSPGQSAVMVPSNQLTEAALKKEDSHAQTSATDTEDLSRKSQKPAAKVAGEDLNISHSDNSASDPPSCGPRVESNFSDTHTEVSADSGMSINSDSIVYKFDFPSDLVGLLIGNHGRNVKSLQEKSGARVRIERSHSQSRFQVCVVEGSSNAVDTALELIRDRFPHLDLSQLSSEPGLDAGSAPVPIPQLRIPQHTFSDVCISSVVTAGNVYLQQPTHSYFRELELLTQQMNAVYSDFSAPLLPEPIPAGVICAAPWIDQIAFCRALILSVNSSAGTCQVRYVDHGSTVELPTISLRQIRSDFLRLPFQATECYLSKIAPRDGQDQFSSDAATFLQKVTEGCVLLCWVHGFAQDGRPLVELFLRHGAQKVSVNKLLVENGFAKSV